MLRGLMNVAALNAVVCLFGSHGRVISFRIDAGTVLLGALAEHGERIIFP